MLHIVKQFIFGLTGMLKCEFAGETLSGGNETTNVEAKRIVISQEVKIGDKSIEANKNASSDADALNKDIQKLKFNIDLGQIKSTLDTLKGVILKENISNSKVRMLKSAMKSLGFNISYENIDETKAQDSKYGSELKIIVKKFQKSRNIIADGIFGPQVLGELVKIYKIGVASENLKIKQAKNKENTSTSSEEEINQETVKTKEVTTSTLDISVGIGKEDFAGLKENINYASYRDMILSLGYEELQSLYTDMNTAKEGNYNERTQRFDYSPTNISKLKEVFTQRGYSADMGITDWGIGGIEMGSLVELVKNVYKTQEIFKNSDNFKDKLAVILDYNQDGLLDNNVHFYTKEKQFFEAITNEQEFENILINLGYTNKKQFDTEFSENYFAARENFKNQLARVLSVSHVLNPGEMIQNPDAIKNFNEAKQEAGEAVNTSIEKYEKTKNLPPQTKKNLKLQAIGLVLGSAVGVGFTFDIQKLTDNIIDSLQIGIINGVPGIGIAKNILKTQNGRFRLDIAAVNLIPMVSASGVIKKAEYEKFKELFLKEIDSSLEVTLVGGVSTLGQSVLMDFSDHDEKTKKGIENAKQEMSEMLDDVFSDIKGGKTFEKSQFKSEPSNQALYEALAGHYKANGSNQELIQYIKEGALNNYERSLYEDSEGLNFVGISAGLLFLSGYLPIPLILVHGENHSTKWGEVETYSSVPKESFYEKSIDTGESNIDNLKELKGQLSQIGDKMNSGTRYNGGDVILDPNKSLSERWEGLLVLSKLANVMKTKVDKNPKYTGVGNLANTPLESVLTGANNELEKMYILSTLSQYMKKAANFLEGNIDDWNNKDKVKNFIQIDKDRAVSFDTLFGFSLEQERDKYYVNFVDKKGIILDNLNISSTEKLGLGFDVTSTIINTQTLESVQGIDALYTNLSILSKDGVPLLVPIDDSKLAAFKTTVTNMNMLEGPKQALLEALDKGNVKLYFYKDPEGFDDRILPVVTESKTTQNTAKEIDVFQSYYSSVAVGLGVVGEQRERVKTIETQEGYVYTDPDGNVQVVTDNNGIVTDSYNSNIPVGSNISKLPPVDMFGAPLSRQANMIVTNFSNPVKIENYLQREAIAK